MSDESRLGGVSEWFVRISLAAGFLSAVADRFGLWGGPADPNVAWGSWAGFVDYVGTLNWFVPALLHEPLGWLATVAEIGIAGGLLSGWQLRRVAWAGGLLLLSFGLTMTIALGVKPPLDYSVFAASAAAFLLAARASEA